MQTTLLLLLILSGVVAAQTPTVGAVANAFAPSPAGLSPGVLASVFGNNFGTDKAALTVTVGSKPAFILAATNGQLNLQIPVELAPGAATLVVTKGGVSSTPFNLTLAAYSPAIQTSGSNAVIVSGSQAVTQVKHGDLVSIYSTGLGATNPPVATGVPAAAIANCATMPQLTLGPASGTLAPIIPAFCGIPVGALGVYQINWKIPDTAPFGTQPLVLKIGGVSSPPVNVTVAGGGPTITSVMNAASQKATPIAPGSLVTVTGTGFGAKDQITGFPGTTFQGVTVNIGGMQAPILNLVASAALQQITVQAPFELPAQGQVAVTLTTAEGTSAAVQANTATTSPGIFRVGYKNYGAVTVANPSFGDPPGVTGFGIALNCASAGALAASSCGRPLKAGDAVQIFATGLGPVTPGGDPAAASLPTGQFAPADGSVLYLTVSQPTVTIGGIAAPVTFSGIVPGSATGYQVTVTIPAGITPGEDVTLTLTVGGLSDSVSIAVS